MGKTAFPYVDKLPGGLDKDTFDYFHEAIAHEEIAHLCTPGFLAGMGEGMVIGLPPVLQFGKESMKEKIGAEVIRGQKRICLAITEPNGGSDVANLLTRAEKTPDGKFYKVTNQEMDHWRLRVGLLHNGRTHWWPWPGRGVHAPY